MLGFVLRRREVRVHRRSVSVLILMLIGASVVFFGRDQPELVPPVAAPETLSERAATTADLRWLAARSTIAALKPGADLTRPALTDAKRRAVEQHDAAA